MRRAAAATAAVALLLAGCSGGQAPVPSEPASSTSTSAVSPSAPQTSGTSTTSPGPSESPSSPTSSVATSAPPGSSPTSLPDDGDSSQPWLTGPSDRDASAVGQEITGVRTGLHDGYDRVVLDLSGSSPELGWFAGFTDEAIEDPTGRPLDVEGVAFLQLGVNGIDWTTDSPDRYSGATIAADGLDVVTEVVFGGLFEGQQQILIGLEEQTAYRMFVLSDPARIVIDIRHG